MLEPASTFVASTGLETLPFILAGFALLGVLAVPTVSVAGALVATDSLELSGKAPGSRVLIEAFFLGVSLILFSTTVALGLTAAFARGRVFVVLLVLVLAVVLLAVVVV